MTLLTTSPRFPKAQGQLAEGVSNRGDCSPQPNVLSTEVIAKIDNEGTLAPSFPRFQELPFELQDEIWKFHCPEFDQASMLSLSFVVEEMLDWPGTHAIYGTTILRESTRCFRRFSGAHRRTYYKALQLFPDILKFYCRREANTNNQYHVFDIEGNIRFNKRKDILFIRHFAPLRDANGKLGLVNYQLGNFVHQAQNVAIEDSLITNDRCCEALLAKLGEIKTVFYAITADSGKAFMTLTRDILKTYGFCYQTCTRYNNITSLYCWPTDRSQSTILDLSLRLNNFNDAANIRQWELLPLAIFRGEDIMKWYRRLENHKFEPAEEDHSCHRQRQRRSQLPFPQPPAPFSYYTPSVAPYSSSIASSTEDMWIVPLEAIVAMREEINMDELTRQECRARWSDILSQEEQPIMLDLEARRARWAAILAVEEEQLRREARREDWEAWRQAERRRLEMQNERVGNPLQTKH